MSASPSRFSLIQPNPKPDVVALSPEKQDESKFLLQLDETVSIARRWRAYSLLGMFATFAAGIFAGYFLFLLWQQISLHDVELARQQISIRDLAANGAAVSNQVSRLKTLDNNVDSLRSLFEAQSRRLGQLEQGQTGMRDELTGMNARWQRQVKELGKTKMPVAMAPPAGPAVGRIEPSLPPPAASPTPSALASSVAPAPAPAEKHNETFSPDLKPTPSAYAQMSPSGLVVWMTPRPGFAKPIPTSVIGHVKGLGMLVHDWDDNNHYFITESGSWIVDQR